MSLLSSLQHPAVQTLGWSLLHFVWQGLAVVAVLALLLIPLRRATANTRYLVECGALLMMAGCPVITWCWLTASAEVAPAIAKPQGVSPVASASVSAPLSVPTANVATPVPSAATPPTRLPNEPHGSELSATPTTPATAKQPESQSSIQEWRRWAEPILPWFVGCWLLGVSLLTIRLLLGWRFVQRIKRLATTPAVDAWHQRCRQLATRLRISRPVRLVESALIEVPTVIGWLRPMILFPASALAGLEPAQLEAILAHELAHIRRHDYLVNLIQTALETLLFYHPAVWWVSRQIRDEREHCCDDIAVEVCGNRVIYARALAEMEELRVSPRLTLAVNTGSLLSRIKRLVYPSTASQQSIWWAASPIAVALVCGLLTTAYLSAAGNTEAKSPPMKFGIELADGVKVELIGVSSPDEPLKWWEADGNPLEKNPLKGINPEGQKENPPVSKQRFAVRITGLPQDEAAWIIDDDASGIGTAGVIGEGHREHMADSYPEASRSTATLRVGIRRGEIGPPMRIDYTGKKLSGPQLPDDLAPWYDIIRWSDIKEVNGQTQITLAPFDLRRQRAYPHWKAVGADQQDYPVARRSYSSQGDTVTFDVPLKRLRMFEVRLQPYQQWVTFENVSLKPGEKTNVKAAVGKTPPVPPSLLAEIESRSKTTVGIANAIRNEIAQVSSSPAIKESLTEPFVSPLIVPQPLGPGTRVDSTGEPLLSGQVQRFGSKRFRVTGWWRYVGFSADGAWIWGKADNRVFAMHRQTGYVVEHGQLPMGTGSVASVMVSPSGKLVAVGMWEDHRGPKAGTMKVVILDALTGEHRQTIEWKSKVGELRAVAVSYDDRLLVTGMQGDVRLWNIADGQQIRAVELPNTDLWEAAFSPSSDSIVLAGHNNSFYWKQADGAIPLALEPKTPAMTVCYSPNGKWFATAADDKDGTKLWDAKTGTLIGRFQAAGLSAHPDGGIAFSPDSQTLAVPVSGGNLVELWNPETLQRIATLPASEPRSVTISKDGKWLATTGGNSRVDVFDLTKRTQVNLDPTGHDENLRSIRFAPGETVITGGSDGVIAIWDMRSGKQRRRDGGHPNKHVLTMETAPDGLIFAASFMDSTVLWDVASGERLQTVGGHGRLGGARAIAFSPDSKRIVSWGDDMFVRWWDARQGTLISENALPLPNYVDPDKSNNPFRRLSGAMTRDGTTLFVLFEKSLFEFDTQSGKLRRSAEMPRAREVRPSPDGRWLAIAEFRPDEVKSFENRVTLVDRESLQPVKHWDVETSFALETKEPSKDGTFEIEPYYLDLPTFSPDSQQLAWSAKGPQFAVDVVDVASGRLTNHIPLKSWSYALDFSTDGKWLATGHYDTTAAIWNLADFAVVVQQDGKDRVENKPGNNVAGPLCELAGHIVDSKGRLVKNAVIHLWRMDGVKKIDLLAGRASEVTTNDDGWFEIKGLSAGPAIVSATFDMGTRENPNEITSFQKEVVLNPSGRAYCRFPLVWSVMSAEGEKYLTSGAAYNSGTWSEFNFNPQTFQAAGKRPSERRAPLVWGDIAHGLQTALVLMPGKNDSSRVATLFIRNTLKDRLISFHRHKNREQFALEVVQPDGMVDTLPHDIWQFNTLRPSLEMNAIYLRPGDEYEVPLGEFEHPALIKPQEGVSVRAKFTLFSDNESVDKIRTEEFFPTSQLETAWLPLGNGVPTAAQVPLVQLLVVDDKTDQPIPKFGVIPGSEEGLGSVGEPQAFAQWQPHMWREGQAGRFEWPQARTYATMRLRVEANGYRPGLTQLIRKADGPITIRTRMIPDSGLDGRVISPSGQPIAHALIGVAMSARTIQIQDRRIVLPAERPKNPADEWRLPLVVETDEKGQFHLPAETTPALVVVTHESGFAELRRDELTAAAPTIVLQPWGKVEGQLVWGDKPGGADEEISLLASHPSREWIPLVSYSARAKTGAEGRFIFENVPPGTVQISRIQESPNAKGGLSHFFPIMHVDVGSSGPTAVVLGGKGQPVVGRLKGLTDWKGVTVRVYPYAPRPGDPEVWVGYSEFASSPQGKLYHQEKIPVQKDGTFRIENVPSAYYQWQVNGPKGENLAGGNITIPPLPGGTSDEPFDLKTITVRSAKAND